MIRLCKKCGVWIDTSSTKEHLKTHIPPLTQKIRLAERMLKALEMVATYPGIEWEIDNSILVEIDEIIKLYEEIK